MPVRHPAARTKTRARMTSLTLALRLTLVLAFVPSLSFSLTTLDTQPFAALAGLTAILLASTARLPPAIWSLLLPAVAALVLAALGSTLATGMRALVIYISPWIFASVAYLACRRGIKIGRIIVFMMYLWALAGMLQWLIDPSLLEFLVNTRTTGDRGVTGLAPEPSFYGMTIIQLWLTLLLVESRLAFRFDILALSLLQILALARSMLAILVLLSVAFTLVLRRPAWLLAAACMLVMFIWLTLGIDGEGSRALKLIEALLNEPSNILYLDASSSERFYHLFLSIKEALLSGLMPHGFEAFGDVIKRGQLQYPSFWWGEPQDKVISGIGGTLFELGWFGCIYALVFFGLLRADRHLTRTACWTIGVGMTMVLLNSVNLAAPCFGLMIGILAARRRAAAAPRPNGAPVTAWRRIRPRRLELRS
jgi:hypothetical protein